MSLSFHHALRLRKTLKRVTLWIHQGARVEGSIFLFPVTECACDGENPSDVFDSADPFVVLKVERTGEPRFFNKRAILRVSFSAQESDSGGAGVPVRCRCVLVDHTVLEGVLHLAQPATAARLYDYLNEKARGFVRLSLSDGSVMLVNREAIVSVEELPGDGPSSPEGPISEP